MKQKRYIIADVHGMCGGVFAALRILEKMIAGHPGEKVFVFHELVHNTAVTADFERRGVCFVDSPEDIIPGAPAVIGAHGISAGMEKILRSIAGEVADATCPLVRRLHAAAAGLTPEDQLIIFGKKDHPEVMGTMGNSGAGKNFIVCSPEDIDKLPELESPFFISQTTVDAGKCDEALRLLKARFPNLRCVPGVCDASRQRQAAVIRLAASCPVVLVAGSPHSSNACRLAEIAGEQGSLAYLVNDAGELPEDVLKNCGSVGLTSGASTPEYILEKIAVRLQELGFSS